MGQKYLTKSEFARFCGVSPAAITKAERAKKIKPSVNGLIDAYGTKNAAYAKAQIARKERSAKGRSESTPFAERVTETRARVVSTSPKPSSPDPGLDEPLDEPLDELEGMDLDGIDLGLDDEEPPRRSPGRPPKAPDRDPVSDTLTEIDYAIEKMKSATALNKARLAAMVRATVRRDFVDQVIALIGTSINDHLITLGDRISPDLAALAGTTEASVVRQIKQAIDEDISTALHEMRRVVQERYERQLDEQ